MNKILPLIGLSLFSFETYASNVFIGGEFGYVIPVAKRIANESSVIYLDKTQTFGGHIGYRFVDNMYIEVSGAKQKDYSLKLEVPTKDNGKTKVDANIYLINLAYDFTSKYNFKPYFIIGAGFGDIKINGFKIHKPNFPIPIVKSEHQKQRVFVGQIGLGLSKPLSEKLDFEVAFKLQVTSDIKLKGNVINRQNGQYDPMQMKQKIGVFRITTGFNYFL